MAKLDIANNNSYMKKHIKTFLPVVFIIFILSFLIVLGINYTRHNSAFLSGIITAWVTINPLEVKVSAPEKVEIDKVFQVEARAINKGDEKIENAKGEIFLPPGLTLLKKDPVQKIGVIPGKKEKKVSWQVKGEEVGNYVISVLVSGKIEGQELNKEASAMVQVKEKRPPGRSLFQIIFDFLFRR